MQDEQLKDPIALLPLRHGVVLPGRIATIPVGRPRSKALADAIKPGDYIVLAVQRAQEVDEPKIEHLHSTATLARVKERVDRGNRGSVLMVDALVRVKLEGLVQQDPYWKALVSLVNEERQDADEAKVLANAIKAKVHEMAPGDGTLKESLNSANTPGLLADRLVGWLDAEDDKKVRVLLERDVVARLEVSVKLLAEAQARAQMRKKIEGDVRNEFAKNQKEAVLRQQMKAIQKELGEEEDDDELFKKLEAMVLPEEAKKAVSREKKRLQSMGQQSPEAHMIRNYLQWMSELPWGKRKEIFWDIDAVEAALHADHEGLGDVKRRILEHLAVLKLNEARLGESEIDGEVPKAKGTLICLVGPPGVGKTSLAQSIAASTGRTLARVSLGGVRDEAEIRGHRRTYIGSMPGRIISALKKCGSSNPVIVLDEIDKLSKGGWSGDPEAALLEVLDPEQNKNFTDHYMEVPFDLSEVLFIATANDLSTLSAPLRDRLEIIEIAGYTADEKVSIAQKHLLPKELKNSGLKTKVQIPDAVIHTIIKDYTRESGVRQVGREMSKLCRALALETIRTKQPDTNSTAKDGIVVDESMIRTHLGKARYFMDLQETFKSPGIATGMAWTSVGGDILFIETTKMLGKGKLEITGQLGDVMKESAQAAMAYLRTHAEELGIDPQFLDKLDIHIHIPQGAVPKDGPSAGVTIFTALASLLSGKLVRSDTAMTGEASLRGRVLAVGGIKTKVLAAHRAGYKRVILPYQNERDLSEIPSNVLLELEVILAQDMRQVLHQALEPNAYDVTGSAEAGRVNILPIQ